MRRTASEGDLTKFATMKIYSKLCHDELESANTTWIIMALLSHYCFLMSAVDLEADCRSCHFVKRD